MGVQVKEIPGILNLLANPKYRRLIEGMRAGEVYRVPECVDRGEIPLKDPQKAIYYMFTLGLVRRNPGSPIKWELAPIAFQEVGRYVERLGVYQR